MASSSVSPEELERCLRRAQELDDLGRKIAAALALIQHVLEEMGEEAVGISFNGGKDCTVLLHLLAAALYARHARSSSALPPRASPNVGSSDGTPHNNEPLPSSDPNTHPSPAVAPPPPPEPTTSTQASDPPPDPTSSDQSLLHVPPPTSPSPPLPYRPIRAIYITAPNPFPALDTFVLSTSQRYGLDLYRAGGGMRSALETYLGDAGRGVRAVLVGTRRGDPNGDVEPLAHTDPHWPAFLRVHPILDWTYHDIWAFLRELDVQWCSLYDEGYTSLGSTTNTVPNPLLRNPDVPGGWDPAWKLLDDTQERAGRLKGPTPS